MNESLEYFNDLIKANERAIRKYAKILNELKSDLKKKKKVVRTFLNKGRNKTAPKWSSFWFQGFRKPNCLLRSKEQRSKGYETGSRKLLLFKKHCQLFSHL